MADGGNNIGRKDCGGADICCQPPPPTNTPTPTNTPIPPTSTPVPTSTPTPTNTPVPPTPTNTPTPIPPPPCVFSNSLCACQNSCLFLICVEPVGYCSEGVTFCGDRSVGAPTDYSLCNAGQHYENHECIVDYVCDSRNVISCSGDLAGSTNEPCSSSCGCPTPTPTRPTPPRE